MARNKEEQNFEQSLRALEEVVERIETGELSLEDSLAEFEKGVRLVKFCNQRLNDMEKRIEVLMKDKEGKLQLTLLDDLDDEKD